MNNDVITMRRKLQEKTFYREKITRKERLRYKLVQLISNMFGIDNLWITRVRLINGNNDLVEKQLRLSQELDKLELLIKGE